MVRLAKERTGLDRRKTVLLAACGIVVACAAATFGLTQAVAADPTSLRSEYEAIGYGGVAKDNPVFRLNERIKSGEVKLDYEGEHGYLESLLKALNINPASQMLVFSKTSLQHPHINAKTPRAIYFNDDTYIGWVQGTHLVEVTTTDDKLGPVYYLFHNTPNVEDHMERETHACLNCHDTYGNMGGGVPDLLASSSIISKGGIRLTEKFWTKEVNDTVPLDDRWGGWYVTGHSGDQHHMGNILIDDLSHMPSLDAVRHENIDTLDQLNYLDTSHYLEPTSDIVALLVLEHQLTVVNELTYIKFKAPVVLQRMHLADAVNAPSWDALPPQAQKVLRRMLDDLVKRMLFVGATEYKDQVSGSKQYADWFEAQGPKDDQGRSLRDFDLKTKLFKHPVSFLIYSSDFNTLPAYARDYVYRQLADILEGHNHDQTYAFIPDQERKTAIQILVDTKPDFVPYLDTRAARNP
jgi:hypothetical protein